MKLNLHLAIFFLLFFLKLMSFKYSLLNCLLRQNMRPMKVLFQNWA